MTERRSVGGLAALLLVALVLGACGGDDERAPAPPQSTVGRDDAQPAQGSERELARAEGGPRVESFASGLNVPWELVFLPDGRALVTERPGQVRLISRSGEVREEPVARVPVTSQSEDGLLGMALDPGFRRNGLVYLYRTTESGNELARYRFEDDRLSEERVLVSGIAASAVHDGGRVRFGPDERLYFSTGDAAQPHLAQDPGSLNGKILRLERGQYRGGGGRPDVFTLGHRNPQGFDWQPGSERMIEAEHGATGNDEVNVLRQGANYGWPQIEGEQEAEGFEEPTVLYENAIAPSGATFVKLPGSAWTGDYLIAALAGEQIRRVGFDGRRVTTDEALFEGDYGRLRSVVEGPDGALYVLTSNRDGRGTPEDGDDRVLRIVPPAD